MPNDKRFVFGPMNPIIMEQPTKKKHRKGLAIAIAKVIMDMMDDGQSVVVVTRYKTDTERMRREGE